MATWCPPWEQMQLSVRLEHCRAMLQIHGMLTDPESAKVRGRIDRLTRVSRSVPPSYPVALGPDAQLMAPGVLVARAPRRGPRIR